MLDNAIFGLSIAPSVTEIFAVKVESCPKSRQILDVFLLSQIVRGSAPQKLYQRYHPYLVAHHVVKLREATPLSSKVTGEHTLRFKPNFDPLWKKIVGATPSLVGCAPPNLCHFLAGVKISGCSIPEGLKSGFPKKSIWWVNISRVNAVVIGLKFTGLFRSNANMLPNMWQQIRVIRI